MRHRLGVPALAVKARAVDCAAGRRPDRDHRVVDLAAVAETWFTPLAPHHSSGLGITWPRASTRRPRSGNLLAYEFHPMLFRGQHSAVYAAGTRHDSASPSRWGRVWGSRSTRTPRSWRRASGDPPGPGHRVDHAHRTGDRRALRRDGAGSRGRRSRRQAVDGLDLPTWPPTARTRTAADGVVGRVAPIGGLDVLVPRPAGCRSSRPTGPRTRSGRGVVEHLDTFFFPVRAALPHLSRASGGRGRRVLGEHSWPLPGPRPTPPRRAGWTHWSGSSRWTTAAEGHPGERRRARDGRRRQPAGRRGRLPDRPDDHLPAEVAEPWPSWPGRGLPGSPAWCCRWTAACRSLSPADRRRAPISRGPAWTTMP